MDWNLAELLWPTIYLLWAVGLVFFIWAMLRRRSKKRRESWPELLAIAAFCGGASLVMVVIHLIGFQLPFTARLGIVSVILGAYAYYSHKRQQK